MAVVGNCCFIFPLKTAVIIIGILSMTVSFAGLMVASSSVWHYHAPPKDILLLWILQVTFFNDIYGIAFHALLFLVSTILVFAAVTGVTPLMAAWLGWSPFVLAGIVVQVITVIVKQPDIALPIISFSLMLCIFIIYATLVVAAHYSESMSTRTVQLRYFDLQEGDLPRVVNVPHRFVARFFPASGSANIVPAQEPVSASTQPLRSDVRDERLRRLRRAYARFMAASRLKRAQVVGL